MRNTILKSENGNGVRYALVTAVRDEEKYIGAMIDSILAQNVLPTKWIVVDDGSTDNTARIVMNYCRTHSFMELVQLPIRDRRMPGGEGAVGHALGRLNLSEFDFVARFDSDLVFEPDYIARMLYEFDRDPKLGIAGGGLYIETKTGREMERVPTYHVRGALKMYRRQCFQEIGSLSSGIGWDTIDEVSAWTKGWKTRSFFQYRVRHCRPTGGGLRAARVYWERGKAEYYTWSHPLFVLAKTVKTGAENLSLLKPVSFLAGFVCSYVSSNSRLQDSNFVKMRRGQQFERMVTSLRPRQSRDASAV
ncbi:MAG: glycosyltransferase family A protein [Candidatus Sulfotelmatobacter sp.]